MLYKNKYGELTSTYGMVGDPDAESSSLEREKLQRAAADANAREASQAELARRNALLQQQLAETQGATQRDVATITGNAAIRAAEARRGYKNGGPVIKGEFKHANPTYTKFGQTGDSSLLAKGRK